jgi:hypothetical protein
VIFGDLLGAAASAALLARLFGICDDDLRRLRTTIHKSPKNRPDLLDWLDHFTRLGARSARWLCLPVARAVGSDTDDELTNSIPAVEMLAITFSGEAQVTALLELVRMILPLNTPNASQPTAWATRHLPSHSGAQGAMARS